MSSDTLPSIEGLPIVGNTIEWGRDPFGFNHRLVTEVSDIAKFKTIKGDICILAHPDYAEQVLVTERSSFGKTSDYTTAFGSGLLAAEGDLWAELRDPLDDFFHPQRIQSYFSTMVERTHYRVDQWEDGETILLAEEMKSLALENIFATLFDKPLEIDGDKGLRSAANDLNKWFNPVSWALPEWVPTPARYRFRQAIDELESEGESLLLETDRESQDNMLSMLANAQDESLFSDDDVLSQLQTFIFAGHDTTGLALTYSLYLLETNPEIRKQFYDEIDTVVGSGDLSFFDVSSLDVTERIINEAIRMYPPVHTIPRVATETVNINGYEISEGMETHVSVIELMRDPRFWDDPDQFSIDRWEDSSPESKGYSYIPFGAGPRTCIGRRFALLEVKLALAIIGQQYRIEPQSELSVEPKMTTQPTDSVPVIVRDRQM